MSVDGLDPQGSGSESEIGSVGDSEEEEWGGIGEGGGVDLPPSSGKHVLKVPAGHELREMKEASELYKSSSFKLQVRIQCNPR
jgi:U3 small nucleolar RNA-associated protein 22